MGKVHILAAALLILAPAVSLAAPRQRHHGRPAHLPRTIVSQEVRNTARKLAHAWVDTASAQTLDQLADRSIAFAGMVTGLYVLLDGKRFSAKQALMDSGLTIIKKNENEADAAAIRNTVYTLMEIADGRVTTGPDDKSRR